MATVLFSTLSIGQQITKDVSDLKEIESIKSHVLKFGDFNKIYNFNKIKFVYEKTNSNYGIYVINKNDFDETKSINEALTIASNNSVLNAVCFVKTTKKDKSNNILEYRNIKNEIEFIINFDLEKQTVSPVSVNKKGCGQALINCINDGYTNQGWVSVGLFLTTAFIPETAAIVAIACYDRVCK